MEEARQEAAELCKAQLKAMKEEVIVLEERVLCAMSQYYASSPVERYTYEMEKLMDKLALLAARIHDMAHGKDCKYDVWSEKYQRSMQRRMRKALGMYDSLDQGGPGKFNRQHASKKVS
jgi:hypothetical protein